MRSSRKAFTLLEMLVSIAIIALIMGILLPVLQRGRELARDTACRSNLRQIQLSMREYEVRTRHWPRTWDDLEISSSSALQYCPSVRNEHAYPTYSFWMMDSNSFRSFEQQVETAINPIMIRDSFAPHFGRSNLWYLHSGLSTRNVNGD